MKTVIENTKKKYKELCQQETDIPIFSRDWWLDAVCGEGNWDVILIENDNVIIGSMPYYKVQKFGILIISPPPLTPLLGPWIRSSHAKRLNELTHQNDVMEMIIRHLPKYGHFLHNFHPSITNWLPFFWNGFEATVHYTYILKDLSNEESLFLKFRESIKGDIRKASKRFFLQVRDDLSFDAFLALNHKTFERQKKKAPYDDEFLRKLDRACQEHNCRKIFIAEDKQGRHHAGAYIVWDENSAYYLMGGGDPDLRNSGASSLCMWEAIKYASKVTQKFDFEGSMIKPIERFFRSFGGAQTPYFRISKTPSKIIMIGKTLRKLQEKVI